MYSVDIILVIFSLKKKKTDSASVILSINTYCEIIGHNFKS